jgi:hypothetical protein
MQLAIAEQLKRRGIDVITVRDLDMLGDEDINHLERAASDGRVLCTHDTDYIDLAAEGKQHKRSVGDWVAFLELVHGVYDAEDMHNLIEYVSVS